MFKVKKISSRLLEKLRVKLDPEAPYTNEILRKLSSPCFKVLVRFVAFSNDFKEARRSVEILANAFRSFNGRYAWFRPRIISFPILRNSYSILKDIIKRKFPFIDFQTFLLSNEELAVLSISLGSQLRGYMFDHVGLDSRCLPPQ